MKVTMLLADSAQEVNGRSHVLGGGWSVAGPQMGPMALAIKIDVPWTAAKQKHSFTLRLLSEDGQDPEVMTESGVSPSVVAFSASRSA